MASERTVPLQTGQTCSRGASRWHNFGGTVSPTRVGSALHPVSVLLGFDHKTPPVVPEVKATRSSSVGLAPLLALTTGLALLMAAISSNASRAGADWSVGVFYYSIAMIYLPMMARLVYPDLPRSERIAIVLTATAGLFAARMIREPVAFIDHDEFLHWLTTNDILEHGRLFTPNALLPVSPKFPGLEIVTSAMAHLSGSSVFASAMLVLATCRMTFMAALYLTFEKLTKSSRTASIACMLYMGSSTFFVFDSHFSYESLAVVFLVLALLSDLYSEEMPGRSWTVSMTLTVPFLIALAMTHHMTAFFAAGIFVAFALLELINANATSFKAKSVAVAALAVGIPLIWSHAMGDPTGNYLGPVFEDGVREVSHLLSSSQSRKLFVSDDGSIAPWWQRAVAIASVGLICIGLTIGFGRALASGGMHFVPLRLKSFRLWTNGRIVLLTILTFAYPLSILFRLTKSGWEIGNRIGPFSFLGVSLTLAIGVASFWQGQSKSALRCVVVSAAAVTIVIGGIISAEGPRILVPAEYRVSADSASVEPMGISAAEWSRVWLGRDNLFASDRINRLLLATYGRQQVATTLRDRRDSSIAIQSEKLSPSDVVLLRQIGIDYVLADLRLATALPVVGVYFDGGALDRGRSVPLAAKALLKFNLEKNVSRPFDNGYQVIFDVRNLDVER